MSEKPLAREEVPLGRPADGHGTGDPSGVDQRGWTPVASTTTTRNHPPKPPVTPAGQPKK